MNLRGRRLSVDNSALADGSPGGKRGSGKTGKKARHSVDNGQMEPPDLNSSMSLRETLAEEQSNGLLQKSSLRKYNKSFHKLFPDIPEDETVTHAFSCSLHREVLYHGRLFISENYLCFYSSVLLRDTKVMILTANVRQVNKHYLSMVSVQTVDREKYTFVSLSQREFTYELIQSRCVNAQSQSPNSSPHPSSLENDPEPEVASGSSSMEDGFGDNGGRQSSVDREESLPRVSAERKETGPSSRRSDAQGGPTDTDGAPPGSWRLVERLSLFFHDRQDLSLFFYFNVLLVMLLLLVSGLIGLQIMALHEQLESLGALAGLDLHQ